MISQKSNSLIYILYFRKLPLLFLFPALVTEDIPEASNVAYINGLLLLFCKNFEMKITRLSVQKTDLKRNLFPF